jgi:transcriptional regulator with XRE-family HTH domain
MDEKTIAANIKKVRTKMKMTLQELADRTGLTKGYLSKVERSEKAPPYSTLSKIVGAMGLEITDVLKVEPGPLQALPIVIAKKEEGRIIRESSHYVGYDYEVLAAGKPGKNMEPFIIYAPDDFTSFFQHEGEEFIYVLEGQMEFKYGEKTFLMSEGDHTYFESRIPHTGRSVGDKRAKLMVVIYFYKRNRQ